MKKDEVYLKHILGEISKIEKFTEGITKQTFFENVEKQYATIKILRFSLNS